MSRLLNITHRGFTRAHPDNTLEAFTAAIQLGADGIECDVHETADGHFVIYHDAVIASKPISEITRAETQSFRLAGQYHVPTLEETLEVCRHRILLNLELKQVYNLDRLLKIVRAQLSPADFFISSFYPHLLTELVALTPEVRRGILVDYAVEEPLKLMELTRANILLPRFASTTPEQVQQLHQHHRTLIAWKCNSRDDLRTAVAWGVDGIITDAPDILKELLQAGTQGADNDIPDHRVRPY